MAEQPQTMSELLRSVIEVSREGRNPVIGTIATRQFAELSAEQQVIAAAMQNAAVAQAMTLRAAKPGDLLIVRQTDQYYRTRDDGTARRLASYVEIIGSRMR